MRFVACLALAALFSSVSAYFVVTAPSANDQWVNGETHTVSWSKGANDGVTAFDIEMSQLSADGLTLVAKNVPCSTGSQKSINILLQDIPPGDDYFMLFLNSTHGIMYGTSQRFSVLASGSSGGNMSSTTNPKASTVTVSGAPNPTQTFAMTFALPSNALRPVVERSVIWVVVGCVLGAAWTLVW